jgi:hypothetical protein
MVIGQKEKTEGLPQKPNVSVSPDFPKILG